MMGKGKHGGRVTAPPLPHEVNLVAPPVITHPRLPSEIDGHISGRSHRRFAAPAAIAAATLAIVATVLFAVRGENDWQNDWQNGALTAEATTFAAAPNEPDDATVALEIQPVEFVKEQVKQPVPTATPLVLLDAISDLNTDLAEQEAESDIANVESPSQVELVLAHPAEEASCPAETEIPDSENADSTLLAMAETTLDIPVGPIVTEDTWEEIGGTGTVSPMPPNCSIGCSNAVANTFGTRIVFAESMKEARELAIDQDKLLFVMHVSGNFAIEGFT